MSRVRLRFLRTTKARPLLSVVHRQGRRLGEQADGSGLDLCKTVLEELHRLKFNRQQPEGPLAPAEGTDTGAPNTSTDSGDIISQGSLPQEHIEEDWNCWGSVQKPHDRSQSFVLQGITGLRQDADIQNNVASCMHVFMQVERSTHAQAWRSMTPDEVS